MRLSIASVLLLTSTLALGQSPFVGLWQTSRSRVTEKSVITVVVVEEGRRLGGAVVLVNPDASDVKLPIFNVKITENLMEFETHASGLCFWSLTLQKNRNRGLLHGGCPEKMMFDEPVRKRRPQNRQ
jgi:hypothetical protein